MAVKRDPACLVHTLRLFRVDCERTHRAVYYTSDKLHYSLVCCFAQADECQKGTSCPKKLVIESEFQLNILAMN